MYCANSGHIFVPNFIVHFLGEKTWVKILAMVIGLAVCYTFGTVWFLIVYTQANGAVGLAMVLAWCVIPFIIPDLVKLGLALALARRLSPVLKLLQTLLSQTFYC